MISFACPVCSQSYTVPEDKAGKRTTCAKCKSKLSVPAVTKGDGGELVQGVGSESQEGASRPSGTAPSSTSETARRPRTKLVVALAGGLLVALVGVGLLVYFLTPNPTRDTVYRALEQNLPPGYTDLSIEEYDRDKAELRFRVTYREHGDVVGVRYEVSRFYSTIESRGGKGWVVLVIGRRPQLDQPFEKWLMVEALFDAGGKLVWKRSPTAAGAGEGPLFEERARQIARAVNAAF